MAYVVTAIVAFWLGMAVAMWGRDAMWREKGDHPYMNRMESGGQLYQVKREKRS